MSQPVKLGGKLYLDGGVADSIPFKAAEKLGFDRVVVILTRDKSYVKKPMNPEAHRPVVQALSRRWQSS